jgi:precorrin-2 dehydrogenase/sirohydrochlorin ferrochelatase
MYPVALNVKTIPILLSGTGELLSRRIAQLEEAGATRLTVKESPTGEDVARASIVMVTGLPRAESGRIAALARAAGKLVNVEDQNDLCDFYFTANVKRGDLIIAVSTSGASPTLARKVRDWIAGKFGIEWEGRVAELATLRRSLKDEGKSMQEVLAASEEHIEKNGWLSTLSPLVGESRRGGNKGEEDTLRSITPSLTLPHQRGGKRKKA